MLPNNDQAQTRKLVIIIASIAVLCGALLLIGNARGWWGCNDNCEASNSQSTGDDTITDTHTDTDGFAPDLTGEAVTLTGTFMCLLHRDTEGPQTEECALGMKLDDGTYYAVADGSADYSLVMGASSGDKITVGGFLKKEESDHYQSSGTVTITSLEVIE